MIKTGTDIVEISRFAKMQDIDLFLKHAFTKRERDYFGGLKNPCKSIAGAFAAKEAFSKYMGSGFRGFGLRDVEVLHDSLGKPYLVFMNNRISADVSISHSDLYACAVVCGDAPAVGDDNAEYIKTYRAMLPKRSPRFHKGNCGRVLAVAGSMGMVGAACLCARAAVRSGSGLVTLAVPQCVQPTAAAKLDEVMTFPLPDRDGIITADAIPRIQTQLEKSDVCAFGPGLGRGGAIFEVLGELLKNSVPLVIDADGLNALSQNTDILLGKRCSVILTPHPGEMSGLTGIPIAEIEQNRTKIAVDFAKKYDAVVLLKGHDTVIASPDGGYHTNTTGNSGMATGGSGDVLTGIIASFVGQGVPVYNAAVLSAFLHGLSGDIAAEKYGEFSLAAGDLIKSLPTAIKAVSGAL